MRVTRELQVEAPRSSALIGEVGLVGKQHSAAGSTLLESFKHHSQVVQPLHDAVDSTEVQR